MAKKKTPNNHLDIEAEWKNELGGTKMYKHSFIDFQGTSISIISLTSTPYTKYGDVVADIANIINGKRGNGFLVSISGYDYLPSAEWTFGTSSAITYTNATSITDTITEL